MAADSSLGPPSRQGPAPPNRPARDGEVSRWPLAGLLLPCVPLVLFLPSALQAPHQQLLLLDQQPVVSQPFRLDDGWWGSPHVELTTNLPANSSAVVQVDVLNAEGRTLLSLRKDAWRETETWVEEGASGTEEQADTGIPLDLKPDRRGNFRLRIALEEVLSSAGQPLDTPLRALLRVRNNSPDGPLLLATSGVGALMAAVLWSSVYGDCLSRRRERVKGDAIDLRLPVAGEGLLRLKLRARTAARGNRGPTSGGNTSLRVRVDDRNGCPRYDSILHLPLRYHRPQEAAPYWEGSQVLRFRLAEPDSLRLRIEGGRSLPERGERLEWLQLVVEDGVVVPSAQKVIDLSPQSVVKRPRGRPAPESLGILGLALAALLSGSVAAITRPGVYRLGQEGTPVAGSGVRFVGDGHSGRWRSPARRADWSRFPGRGPGAAK